MTVMVTFQPMPQAVIYLATNAINGKMYVGKTTYGLRRRWNQHKSHASKGSQLPFHRALRKYGDGAFWLHIVEVCDESLVNDRERYWIDRLGTLVGGYNASTGGEGTSGYRFSVEQREKVRAARREQVMKPEHIAALHAGRRGQQNTDEHKSKVGAAVRGRKRTPEQVANIAAAHLGISAGEYVARRAAGQAHCGGYGLREPHWYDATMSAQRGRPCSPCRECSNAYEREKRRRKREAA